MKRIFAILLLLALSIPSFAQSVSTAQQGMPLPVADGQIYKGFYIPATQTLTLFGTATKVGTLSPGTTQLIVVASGAINFGNASATVGHTWPVIADGAYQEFSVSPLNPVPDIYLINNVSGATSTARIICGK